MRCFPPAKVNLSLRILGRRPDGFHAIETLMAPISLTDELEIEAAGEGIEFTCTDPSVPSDETNLVVRAARLFQAKTGQGSSVRIRLTKNIPHGAGLGGGSSDAASTLLMLNEIFRTGLGVGQLTTMAAALGSDVPFFLHRSAAICRGRGDEVTPTTFDEPMNLLLIKPPFGVPTPWAYSRWLDAAELPRIDYAAQQAGAVEMTNDLERPVFEKFIFLAHGKRWLRSQPEVVAALMSGSGSTLFAVVKDAIAAEVLAVRSRAEFGDTLWTACCRTI